MKKHRSELPLILKLIMTNHSALLDKAPARISNTGYYNEVAKTLWNNLSHRHSQVRNMVCWNMKMWDSCFYYENWKHFHSKRYIRIETKRKYLKHYLSKSPVVKFTTLDLHSPYLFLVSEHINEYLFPQRIS